MGKKNKNKFKIKMKLQGFELEIEGSREDAALISNHVGKQISDMLDVESIISGEASPEDAPEAAAIEHTPSKAPRKKRASGPSYSKEEKLEVKAVTFSHNPEKYGNPMQEWKVLQKAMWLLYTLQDSDLGDQHPGARLSNTFNEQFKQAGKITTSNINRDLGRAKSVEKPAWIGEDKAGNLGFWFLTDTGRQIAQSLVAEARGDSTPT